MTGQELFELAAKGAGYWVEHCRDDEETHIKTWTHGNYSKWNPLEDDGDAIRAATNAGLSIERSRFTVAVSAMPTEEQADMDERGELLAVEPLGKSALCPHKATRQAIVRALAVLGARS